jgi:hypothetical protein
VGRQLVALTKSGKTLAFTLISLFLYASPSQAGVDGKKLAATAERLSFYGFHYLALLFRAAFKYIKNVFERF